MSKARTHICRWEYQPHTYIMCPKGKSAASCPSTASTQLPATVNAIITSPSRRDYVTSMGKCHALCLMAKVQERRALTCMVISTSRNIQGPRESWGHTVTENGIGHPCVCVHTSPRLDEQAYGADPRESPGLTLICTHCHDDPQDPEIHVALDTVEELLL